MLMICDFSIGQSWAWNWVPQTPRVWLSWALTSPIHVGLHAIIRHSQISSNIIKYHIVTIPTIIYHCVVTYPHCTPWYEWWVPVPKRVRKRVVTSQETVLAACEADFPVHAWVLVGCRREMLCCMISTDAPFNFHRFPSWFWRHSGGQPFISTLCKRWSTTQSLINAIWLYLTGFKHNKSMFSAALDFDIYKNCGFPSNCLGKHPVRAEGSISQMTLFFLVSHFRLGT